MLIIFKDVHSDQKGQEFYYSALQQQNHYRWEKVPVGLLVIFFFGEAIAGVLCAGLRSSPKLGSGALSSLTFFLGVAAFANRALASTLARRVGLWRIA